jgi:HEPN domain-containing protein
MSQMHLGHSADFDDRSNQEELERLLVEGVSIPHQPGSIPAPGSPPISPESKDEEDVDEDADVLKSGDIQGAIGLFAEAAQDMATAGVELGLGRHFACADFCNQAAEKAAQAVSLFRFGRKSMYDHDLGALGALVGASEDIQEEMAVLTPFHPETFYANTPPEDADAVIDAGQASAYMQNARHVLRWARHIILDA